MTAPQENIPASKGEGKPIGKLSITLDDGGAARVERLTAESETIISLWRGQGGGAKASFTVADSIDVSDFPEFLNAFCEAADLQIEMSFRATQLSSSHVVLEDAALAIGAALFEMMRERMEQTGVNGAGSSLKTAEDFHDAGVSASISLEGRKFLKIVSATTIDDFRWRNILGHSVFGNLRSEDIDDFVDALAGGMRASIFLHERRAYDDAEAFWRDAIDALGAAVNEAFAPNEARKGLPPGVKATLF